ncbi:MAG: helix-turn-helix domain-containing protein [Chitinophagales bacterium]|nr:helix-turn-helix domain-containing protein [Chitinophagales bacterium]
MPSIVGFSISLFIFIILLLKKEKELSDKILTSWIGYIALHILLYHFLDSGFIFKVPFLIGVLLPLPILHSVFLYFYTRELTYKNAFKAKYWYIHLVPFLLLYVLLIPFFSLPAVEKIEVFQSGGAGYEWFMRIQIVLFILSAIIYNLAAFRVVRKYKKEVLNYISNSDQQMLKWVESLIIGLSIIWVIVVLSEGDDWIFIAVSAFVCFIGIYGFKQVPVYFIQSTSTLQENVDNQPQFEKRSAQPISKEKYKKSGLSNEGEKILFERLEEKMRLEHLYEKNDLTLAEVAILINEPTNHLSQAINSQAGATFYNYINKYRIEAFIEKLDSEKSQQYTYLALAMECGFNSKSTFNKYFKKYTGKTPTEYLKSKV